jgi:hypothetical protein
MARKTQGAPPEGGAIQPADPNAVRTPIKQMTGDPDEIKMAESLPTNTLAGDPDAPVVRRKRRTKQEMASGRSIDPIEDDPLMADPVYRAAVEEMRAAGLSGTVKGGFETVAVITKDDEWELQKDEVRKVDGFSYVLSKKYVVLDPTRHWIGMLAYFLALMGTFIFKRAAKIKGDEWLASLHSLFTGDEKDKDAQEREDEKAQSV